jgi:hypothetical protein
MKYIIKYIFIIIFIFIFFVFTENYIFKEKIESFEDDSIIFLSKEELFNILNEDNDNYYKKFLNNDFIARNIKNIDEYKYKIEESVTDFTEYEKNKLRKCIHLADTKLLNTNLDWFQGKDTMDIIWKIGLINGKLYENGLPHTRNDTIIFSKKYINNSSIKNLMKTLIHEKIHLYQKKYPDKINSFLKKYNFTKYKKRTAEDNTRANPDIDEWIYANDKNEIFKAVYIKNPKTIEDINYYAGNGQSYEHPFEKMAIEIEHY